MDLSVPALNNDTQAVSYANSRIPVSAQQGVHGHLAAVVQRHLVSPLQKPFAPYNVAAFQDSLAGWDKRSPLILDAGCGVGNSTIELAFRYPDHWVIGVDQSQERLLRGKAYPLLPSNMILVRADLVDFWRLLYFHDMRLARHYILYPNPWPKIGHLGRRWHAHPVFPFIPALGGLFECRTNWRIYAEEVVLTLKLSGVASVQQETFVPENPLSPFEKKYLQSGQRLYRISCIMPEELPGCHPALRMPRMIDPGR